MPLLKQTLHGAWDSFFALLVNRLELFAVELREEQERFIRLLVVALLSLLLLALGVTLVVVTVLLLAPPEYRPWLCLGCGLVCLLSGLLGWWRVRSGLCRGPAPFETTRTELKKDCGVS